MIEAYILKPCPCCGGSAMLKTVQSYVTKGWRVVCDKGCVTTMPVWIDAPLIRGDGLDESTRYTSAQAAQIAVEKWNRRAEA